MRGLAWPGLSLVSDGRGREVKMVHLTEPNITASMTKSFILHNFIKLLTITRMSAVEDFCFSWPLPSRISKMLHLYSSQNSNVTWVIGLLFFKREKLSQNHITKHQSLSRVICTLQLLSKPVVESVHWQAFTVQLHCQSLYFPSSPPF